MKTKKLLTPIDIIFIGWFIVTLILILFRTNPIENVGLLVIYHILVIVAAISFYKYSYGRLKKSKTLLLFRFTYPLFFFILQFEEVHLVNNMYFSEFLDPFFIALEEKIFGMQPSLKLWYLMPWDIFSEYMHFVYFMFYPIFGFVALVPFIKRRYEDFAEIVFIVAFSFYICYAIFFVLPVAGPRIVFPDASKIPHNGYLFAMLLRFIYAHAAIEGAAFPSSHCCMAVVNLLIINRYIKWARIPALVIVASLVFSTFYLRYHYVVDAVAGVVLAFVVYPLSVALLKRLKKMNLKWITDVLR